VRRPSFGRGECGHVWRGGGRVPNFRSTLYSDRPLAVASFDNVRFQLGQRNVGLALITIEQLATLQRELDKLGFGIAHIPHPADELNLVEHQYCKIKSNFADSGISCKDDFCSPTKIAARA
jgi:hypothetical protein